MEKFDVNNIPKEYLRASFTLASSDQRLTLANIFAPVVDRLIQEASTENIIKIGFISDKEGVGKSALAESVLSIVFGNDAYQKYLAGNVWNDQNGNSVLHFDHKRIEQTSCLNMSPNLINLVGIEPSGLNMLGMMPIKNELARLKKETSMHFVEWPEGRNSKVNALWSLAQNEDNTLSFEFYCTDEIAAIPETLELLRNVDDLRMTQTPLKIVGDLHAHHV